MLKFNREPFFLEVSWLFSMASGTQQPWGVNMTVYVTVWWWDGMNLTVTKEQLLNGYYAYKRDELCQLMCILGRKSTLQLEEACHKFY
jgi:hypothetical protein